MALIYRNFPIDTPARELLRSCRHCGCPSVPGLTSTSRTRPTCKVSISLSATFSSLLQLSFCQLSLTRPISLPQRNRRVSVQLQCNVCGKTSTLKERAYPSQTITPARKPRHGSGLLGTPSTPTSSLPSVFEFKSSPMTPKGTVNTPHKKPTSAEIARAPNMSTSSSARGTKGFSKTHSGRSGGEAKGSGKQTGGRKKKGLTSTSLKHLLSLQSVREKNVKSYL